MKRIKKEIYNRKCHDCKKPTNNYRCTDCLLKWKKENKTIEGAFIDSVEVPSYIYT